MLEFGFGGHQCGRPGDRWCCPLPLLIYHWIDPLAVQVGGPTYNREAANVLLDALLEESLSDRAVNIEIDGAETSLVSQWPLMCTQACLRCYKHQSGFVKLERVCGCAFEMSRLSSVLVE